MKNFKFAIKTILPLITAAAIALPALAQEPSSPLAGLTVRDGKLLDSYGKPFIFRGVTIDHTLAPEKTLQAIRDIAAAGANSAQIELSLYPDANLFPRIVVAQVREIIAECKANKLICVLEPNDAAGYPHYTRVASDILGFWTWPDMLDVLKGNQAHIVLGLGNQHFAGGSPVEYDYRMYEYANSLVNSLPAGFVAMIDGNDWSEDTSKLMFELAKRVKSQASDLSKHLIYSVDMFYEYQNSEKVHDYIAGFNEIGAPLVIGGFARTPYYHPFRPAPLQADAPQLPAEAVMQYAEQYGAGYFGWSWSGNKNVGPNVVTNYDASALTNWGKLLFNDPNGIKATAKLASIYENVSSSSSSSSAPNRPPVGDIKVGISPVCADQLYWTLGGQVISLSDPDGHSLSYQWSLTDQAGNPVSNALTSNDKPEITSYKSWRVIASPNTSYNVTLKITDSWGASTSVTKAVTTYNVDCSSSSSSFSIDISSSSSSSVTSSRPTRSSSNSSSTSSSKSTSSFRPSSSSSYISSRSSSSSSSSLPFMQGICTYHIQSQWKDGFTATIRLKNASGLPINGWDVKWQYPDTSKVTNFWNAKLSGTNPYSAKNLGWNATIQPGQTVEFGFQGSKPAGPAVTPAFTGTVCLPTIVQ